MFLRFGVFVAGAVSLVFSAVAAPPAPTGSKDVVLAVYYSPDRANLPSACWDLAGSASSRISVASWRMTDGTLAAVLSAAASGGVAVRCCFPFPSTSSSAQWQLARGIVASGGTVYSCVFPEHIANNFISVDGTYTQQGNYYFSPTAVQAGSYLMAVSGTHSAAVAEATFATLAASGTPVVADLSFPFRPAGFLPGLVDGDRDRSCVCVASCGPGLAGCGPSPPSFAFPPPPSPSPSQLRSRWRPAARSPSSPSACEASGAGVGGRRRARGSERAFRVEERRARRSARA